jgi:hypothetical protein
MGEPQTFGYHLENDDNPDRRSHVRPSTISDEPQKCRLPFTVEVAGSNPVGLISINPWLSWLER